MTENSYFVSLVYKHNKNDLSYLQEAKQRHIKTYTSEPCLHKGIVLGKKNSSEHHFRPYILCIVNHEMPWYFLSWVLGSDIYLYQETLYRSKSCRRKLRTSPCGPPRMATRDCPTHCPHYSCSSIPCRSTWLLSSALSPPFFCLSFIIGMSNRSCILKLRINLCFLCNFLCMLRCKSQIAPKKTQCPSCFTRNFRNMLTPFQVVRDSESKVFAYLEPVPEFDGVESS